ncbi:MAG TPA: glutamate 5-kinase [Acidimicrobiia bacterium]|nr:glutamate 5-kinase [Acidimicrobiia bacterium]
MRRPVPAGGRVVVKIGSSSLVGPDAGIDRAAIERVAGQIADSWDAGLPTVLVTSGAVAAGLGPLGFESRPTDVASLQTAAAVGQGLLMHSYAEAFAARGRVAGQVLLTRDVLANRDQYLYARQTLDRMLQEGVVPVVNENDTIAIDGVRFGDNDRLAAIVSHLVGASLLVLLTDTEGLFSSDPRLGEAEFLAAVDHADERLDRLHGSGPLGSGGVATKVQAARIAAFSQIPTIIASADASLRDLMEGEDVGTWVEPRKVSLPARKLWIAFCQPVGGRVTIDEGAVQALVERGTSLLPVGVVAVDGKFSAGETVDVVGPDRQVIGRGLARMPATTVRERMGRRGGDEVIHRDELAVFAS